MTELSDKIVELGSQGYSYNKIKEETGASKGTISYWLGKGQKEKNQHRMTVQRNKIREWLIQDKESKPCTDCGGRFPFYVTHYDHLPQYTKSFGIAQFKNHTVDLEKIKAEVAKCELVCANCHAVRTYTRQEEARERKGLYNTILDMLEDEDYTEEDWDADYVR